MGNYTPYRPSKEEIEHNKWYQNISIKLAIVSIGIALFMGGTVIFLGIQTGQVLEEIKIINQKEFEINNIPPFALAKTGSIYLDRNYTNLPKHTFDGIEIDPFSNHSLRIAVVNAELVPSIGNSFCMFEEIPKIRLVQGDSIHWKIGDPPKNLKPYLVIDYKIKNEYIVNKNSNEKNIRHAIASVVFELHIQDLHNNIITKDKAYSDFIVMIDHTETGITC